MLNLIGRGTAHTCDGISRRDFLQVGTLGAVGFALPDLLAARQIQAATPGKKDDKYDDRSVIMIFNLGAPSQIDTCDLKPDAPAEIRGPFKPITTNVPGIQISEILPRHAKLADKFSLVRTCYHTAAAVHDTGPSDDADRPAVHRRRQHAARRLRAGSILRGRKTDLPAHVILPEPMGPTGGNLPHGQDAGLSRQGVRSVRADGRSLAGRTSRCPTCCRRRRSARRGSSAAASCAQIVDETVKQLRGQRRRQADGQQLRGGLPPDDQPAGPRGVRPGEGAAGGPRALRHEPLRPVLPARRGG